MTREKIIEYIDMLVNQAKQSDKYFTERNELYNENQKLIERMEKATKIIENVLDIWQTKPSEIATLDLKELLEILKRR